jgi:hypothetical protein
MIPLEGAISLAALDLPAELAAHWPDLAPSSPDASDEALTLQLGGTTLAVAQMPMPIPPDELEGPSATSLLWPSASDALRSYPAHLVVGVTGELSQLELFTLATQATASLLALIPEALGVYVGSAGMVVRKDIYVGMADDALLAGELPVLLWVSIRVGSSEDHSSAGFTTGLAALGHMEIETPSSPEQPSDLMERINGLAGYVLGGGAVIRDGDTVGGDAKERIRVTYADSAFCNPGKVMRLDYAQAKKRSRWRR